MGDGRLVLLIAALAGGVAVALGAGGAHGLRATLDAENLARVETAVRYQMWHALALLGVGAMMARSPDSALTVAALAWTAGILLFCGSLLLLAFTGQRFWAHVAPVGGLSLILGWGALGWYAVRLLRS